MFGSVVLNPFRIILKMSGFGKQMKCILGVKLLPRIRYKNILGFQKTGRVLRPV